MIAVKLDPTSQKIQRLLAKTEEVFGDYDSARDRLSRVINSLKGDKRPPKDMLFFCRKVRGRAAFLGVEEQLKSGAKPDPQALKIVELALADLKHCSDYLFDNKFSNVVDHDLKHYRVLHDQARATLTQAELELTLGSFDDADRHLNNVHEMIGSLNVSARASKLKVPAPISLSLRLKEDKERLRFRVGLASGESRLTPSDSSILGGRSG